MALSLDITGRLLQEADLLAIFDEIMKQNKVDILLRKKAFTVLAELINNAIDHGVLNLESSLKSDFSGFAEYLEKREAALSKLTESEKVHIDFNYCNQNREISFGIIDSGKGYQRKNVAIMKQDALSGRGIKLVEELCQEYVVHAPGNHSSVVIK